MLVGAFYNNTKALGLSTKSGEFKVPLFRLVIEFFFDSSKFEHLSVGVMGWFLGVGCTYKCRAFVSWRTSAISHDASETGEAARRFSDSESDEVIDVSDDEMADDEAAEGFDQ